MTLSSILGCWSRRHRPVCGIDFPWRGALRDVVSQRCSTETFQATLPGDAVDLLDGVLHVHIGRNHNLDPTGCDIPQLGASCLSSALCLHQHVRPSNHPVDDDR